MGHHLIKKLKHNKTKKAKQKHNKTKKAKQIFVWLF
jgi:hypothetical protein